MRWPDGMARLPRGTTSVAAMTAEAAPTSALAALAALWEESRTLMALWVSTIEEAVISLLAGRGDVEALRVAERQAHKLAGSMGMFGYHQGSDLALEIERLLQGSGPLAPDVALRLSELAVDLRAEIEREAVPLPAEWALAEDGPEILVVDADSDFAHRVVEQALHSGIRATTVDNAAAARSATAERQPALVLVDPVLAGRGEEGLGLVAELSAATMSPVVVVSEPVAGLDRVTVSRAGGHSLLGKPVAPRTLISSVIRILDRIRSDASIVVVDDDPTIAAYLRALLAPLRIHVEGVHDPRQVWRTLADVRPDLLVLDLDLPTIDGLELCRMVRRDPVWSDLPIVFLTGTDETEWIREMYSAGADDHIPKPMVADDIVTRIGNRLERSRSLRSRDDTDRGSALATTVRFTTEVDRMLALARRSGAAVALGVAEVDDVPALVGARGRAAADDAVAATGRLLSRSARPEDVIGWAGAGRIGMAMYEHEVAPAVERLARFLEAVRREELPALAAPGAASLQVTASVGVAAFPGDGEGATSLLAAAGKALERAQGGGGDQVVATAGPAPARTVDVVVVDDDETIGPMLLHALATRGYRAEWVRDGAEAATMLVDHEAVGARVVLLDVGLPGLDGLSVLRTLGEAGVLRSTRVIMLTLRSSEAEVLQALELGAYDHVAKPFSLPILLYRIQRALDSLPA